MQPGKFLTVMTVFWSVILLALISASCAPSPSASLIQSGLPRQQPVADQNDLGQLVDGNNAFAFDLYRALNSGSGNLFFSPYSLSQALAMTYAGALGATAQEMAETLHFSLPQERLHPAFNALDLDLTSRSAPPSPGETPEPAFELNIANAIWGQQGLTYRQEYLDLLAQSYGAGLRLADFTTAPDQAVDEINRWASEATKGRIEEILKQLSQDTRLVLANAIYFNALWARPFNEEATESEPFYLLDGGEVSAPLMHQTEDFLYTEGEGYQAVSLPYMEGGFSMLVVLPGQGKYAQVEEKLDPEWIQQILTALESNQVILTMPKFRFETPAISLRETLSAMGMPVAFSGAADFSGITGDVPLKIDDVVHKAFIDVSEKRTEAAAVTVVEMQKASLNPDQPLPVEMRIDRPFIFLIRDDLTNTILFIGRVLNPIAGD